MVFSNDPGAVEVLGDEGDEFYFAALTIEFDEVEAGWEVVGKWVVKGAGGGGGGDCCALYE